MLRRGTKETGSALGSSTADSSMPPQRRTNESKRNARLIVVGLAVAVFGITSSKYYVHSQTKNIISMEKSAVVEGKQATDEASRQSFGFFNDITNEHWKRYQTIMAGHSNHKFPEKPLTHNPHFDTRNKTYFNSYPAWWQTVSNIFCKIHL